MKKQEITNTLQTLDNLIDVTQLSPDQASQVIALKSEIENLIVGYAELADRIPSHKSTPSELPDENTKTYTPVHTPEVLPENPLALLEDIGINQNSLIVTPINENDFVQRQVTITEQGIVILKNIDPTRVGVLNELYTPGQYSELVKKVQSGVYKIGLQQRSVPVTTSETVVPSRVDILEDKTQTQLQNSESVITASQSQPQTKPIETPEPEQAPKQKPDSVPIPGPAARKSLAELLGSTQSVRSQEVHQVLISDQVSQVSENSLYTAEVTPVEKPVETVQVLPISLEKIDILESSLEKERNHKNVYEFIAATLGKKALEKYHKNITSPQATSLRDLLSPDVVVDNNTVPGVSATDTMIPVATKNIGDLSLEDYQKVISTNTATNNKVDPLSMFN